MTDAARDREAYRSWLKDHMNEDDGEAIWQAALAYRDQPQGYWANKVANCKHAKAGTIVRAWRCQECKDLLPAHLHENAPAPPEGKEPR